MKRVLILILLGLPLVGRSFAQEPQSQPRVFLQATSHGNVWAAHRDQSMEMANRPWCKSGFWNEKDCVMHRDDS
jgi:hypothetical protein